MGNSRYFQKNGVTMRTCPKCGRDLPLSAFRKNGKHAIQKHHIAHYHDCCIKCEDLYERLGLPLKEEKDSDLQTAKFIYDAF